MINGQLKFTNSFRSRDTEFLGKTRLVAFVQCLKKLNGQTKSLDDSGKPVLPCSTKR